MVVNQKMLNCEQVWREISNYVDGEVDAALRSAMDEHFRELQALRVGAGGDAECGPALWG